VNGPRILIAGIGNIFLGDDAFGTEVAQLLSRRTYPDGVRVIDFGIRGFDLAYALLEELDLAILVDATARGGTPGTLYVLEPDVEDLAIADGTLQTHGLDPRSVFRLVRSLGGRLPPLRIVGCEPATLGEEENPVMGLSVPVQAAVAEAIRLIDALIADVLDTSVKGATP
jgi:hydrogenase maturation protease